MGFMGLSVMVRLTTVGALAGGAGPKPIGCLAFLCLEATSPLWEGLGPSVDGCVAPGGSWNISSLVTYCSNLLPNLKFCHLIDLLKLF